jgi:hypothetical protein
MRVCPEKALDPGARVFSRACTPKAGEDTGAPSTPGGRAIPSLWPALKFGGVKNPG